MTATVGGDMQALLQKDVPANMRDGAFRTLGAVMIRLGLARDAAQYYQELIDGSDDPQQGATFLMLLTELYYDMRDFTRAEEPQAFRWRRMGPERWLGQ